MTHPLSSIYLNGLWVGRVDRRSGCGIISKSGFIRWTRIIYMSTVEGTWLSANALSFRFNWLQMASIAQGYTVASFHLDNILTMWLDLNNNPRSIPFPISSILTKYFGTNQQGWKWSSMWFGRMLRYV